MTEMTFAQALALGLTECLDADPRVTLINSSYGGLTPFRATYNVLREKYADRITDTPISELGYCGIAVGAAMTGLRPIVALSTAAFSFEAWPQIVNEAAVACYGSAGQVTAPVVFHMLAGIRGAGAVQHSHAPQAMFCNAPGLQVVAPGSPADARGLMRTVALKSNNPTIFIDHQRLQGIKGEVDEKAPPIPLGVADIKRQGSDVTIVAVSIMVPRALEAAATLAQQGISVEVVDPRTLVPLDKATILKSVAKTGRAVVCDESQLTCGIASELAAIIAEDGFHSLKAPIRRVGIPNVPVPYHQAEEEFITPTADKIVAAAKAVCGR
jgi:acetoin:2,6-dichlorophenolindophenol oxidoreductase subunit beta